MFFLKPTPVAKKLEEALYEAQREHVHHTMSAAHHAALAKMYGERADWIRQQQGLKGQSAGVVVKAS